MDPKIAKKTQDTLGKIIKKPPLTDKLLGKPPFRFLHDVVTSVIKTTGFMKGLYTEAEMNSENVKEKEGKVAFLQKAVDMVAAVTGKNLAVKPVKIVAGHEPENTNEFLQALATAINAKVDNDEFVKKVLSGGGGGGKEEKKDRDKDRTRSASRRKEGEEKHRKEDKERSRERDKDRDKERSRSERHKDRETEEGEGDKEKERHRDRDRDKREKSRDREDRHRDKDRDKDKERDKDKRKKAKEGSGGVQAKEAKDKSARSKESNRTITSQKDTAETVQQVKKNDSGAGDGTGKKTPSPRKKADFVSPSQKKLSAPPQQAGVHDQDVSGGRKHQDTGRQNKAVPVTKKSSSLTLSTDANPGPGQAVKAQVSSPVTAVKALGIDSECGLAVPDALHGLDGVDALIVMADLNEPSPTPAPIKTKEASKTSSQKVNPFVHAATDAVDSTGGSMHKRVKPGGSSPNSVAAVSGDSQKRSILNDVCKDGPSSPAPGVIPWDDSTKVSTSRKHYDLTQPGPKSHHKAPTDLKAPADVMITQPSPQSKQQTKTGRLKQQRSPFSKQSKAHGEKSAGRQAKASPSKFNLQGDPPPDQSKHKEEKENESPEQNGEKESSQETPSRLQRPTSAKGARRRRQGREARDEEDEEFQQRGAGDEPAIGEDDLPPQIAAVRKMARPSSARPAPPRPKQEGVEAEPAMRLGVGAPTNLIVDNEKASDDEDENFLVEESAPPPPTSEPASSHAEPEDDAEHGALVKKMLESKKEAEQQQQQPTKKTEIERPAMSDAQRRKQRELVAKEIERLQSSIQSLTRSANPLGKIMDYVQEDLDSMQKELDRWRTENKEHALALRRERNVTDRAIEPLKAQLADLDRAIADQLDLIAATKSNILRNDQKAGKMLLSLAKS